MQELLLPKGLDGDMSLTVNVKRTAADTKAITLLKEFNGKVAITPLRPGAGRSDFLPLLRVGHLRFTGVDEIECFVDVVRKAATAQAA